MKTKICLYCSSEFTTRDYRAKFCSRKCASIAKTHKRITKQCLTCGKEFPIEPKHPDVKYCSHKCHGVARRKQVDTICLNCGNVFQQYPSGHKRFCSQTCSNRFHQHPDPTKHKTCICEWCEKSFETRHDAPGRFCGHQCMSEYAASVSPGAPRKEEIHITLNCKICGNPYQTTAHQVRERGSTCCSRQCVNVLQSQLKRKEGNPNYRGGSILYRGANWGRQSRKALKRDGYCCQICHKKLGRKKSDYGIHHIKPFREFDGDYENANRLSNLITLCRRCHARVEFGGLACPLPLALPE